MNSCLFLGAPTLVGSPPMHWAGQAAVVLTVEENVLEARSRLSEFVCSECYKPDQESTVPHSWEKACCLSPVVLHLFCWGISTRLSPSVPSDKVWLFHACLG